MTLSRPFRAAVGALLLVLFAVPQIAHAQSSNELAYLNSRLSAQERLIAELTGRLEQAEFQLRQLSAQVDQLKAGPAAAATAPGGPQTTYNAPAAAAATPGPGQGGGSTSRTLGSVPASDLDTLNTQSAGAVAAPQAPAAATAGQSPEAMYNAAFAMLNERRWDDAEATLNDFLQRYPNDPLAGNAKYWLGETYYVRQNYQQAARTFAEGFQQYPNSPKAPDNLLKLGMSLGRLDQKANACGTLGELQKRYPTAPAQILQRAQAEQRALGC